MEWGIHRPRLGGQCQGVAESLSTCFTFCTQFRKKEECNILMIYACKIPIYVLETWTFNPSLPPREFCRKMRFEASRAVFQSLSGNKELNKTYYKAAPGSLLIQMQNISSRSWGMHGKQNFKTFSPPLFFCFSCLNFFCWAFSRLHFSGKSFGKAFRILGLDERKGRWVVKQDFKGNFQVHVTSFFFAFFSGLLYWIVLNLVWFERSLHPVQVSG